MLPIDLVPLTRAVASAETTDEVRATVEARMAKKQPGEMRQFMFRSQVHDELRGAIQKLITERN